MHSDSCPEIASFMAMVCKVTVLIFLVVIVNRNALVVYELKKQLLCINRCLQLGRDKSDFAV